jgi:hypothetical protein
MIRTVEAVLESDGRVRFLEPLDMAQPRRALVMILDEPAEDAANLTALLSEAALEDWHRPEEDEAWSHLQKGQ